MAKKAKAKKVKVEEIEVIDPIVIEEVKDIIIVESDQIKLELKEIEALLNGGYDPKSRTSLLKSQQRLQIKLKSL